MNEEETTEKESIRNVYLAACPICAWRQLYGEIDEDAASQIALDHMRDFHPWGYEVVHKLRECEDTLGWERAKNVDLQNRLAQFQICDPNRLHEDKVAYHKEGE